MFNKGNTKSESKIMMPTSNVNIIGSGTSIQGDIVCEGDIRIDGQVNGLVSTKAKIVVGPEGEITGDLVCQSADILGKVTGIIKVDDLLFLKGNALVKGDVYTVHFEMEPTAKFNGRCYMDEGVTPVVEPSKGKNGKSVQKEATTEQAQ
ncbi:polymer-forming cytoskeletal protein [Chitinophaga pendula]|uniref:bactofilin family protein n=1 Tax=Chitinophaga TaxID=79328 RepID=UPI000BB08FFB|nr:MULTISPECIES: polymer-forming cytoskeletal protein [Chitinophaga]ASZ14433.1 cell shape determination protein CcmA [Chitinophaga sp. MD30]UCJ07912.1 polymer-forming cytoskeletal protein [Chitinophaga pendula]